MFRPSFTTFSMRFANPSIQIERVPASETEIFLNFFYNREKVYCRNI